MKIAITGTPGCGKTTVAEKVADKTSMDYVSINHLAREKDCIISYDEERGSDIVDIKALREETEELDDCILDGHLSHFMENDMVFVLRCKPSVLKERLEEKGWEEDKINENVEAEIVGVIEGEARNSNDEVYSIDTTDRDIEEVVNTITEIIDGESGEEYSDHFDWIEQGEVDNI